MAEKNKSIIIKRGKKGHAGHHGGSWKVAYADFVTAMMAFFLLLWLLTMSSSEKRAVLAQYFKHFSLFEKSGNSFMMDNQPSMVEMMGDAGFERRPSNLEGTGSGKGMSAEELGKKLQKAVEEKLAALKNQVIVDIFEGGVRIQIVDTEGSSMFPLGSAEPNDKAKNILKLVAENIKNIPNRIVIEGHTDASPFKGGQITNWELSTSRASAARMELEANGIDSNRIARVVGYADKELLIKDNPKDHRNRRMSIILLDTKTRPVDQSVNQPETKGEIQKVLPPGEQMLVPLEPLGKFPVEAPKK